MKPEIAGFLPKPGEKHKGERVPPAAVKLRVVAQMSWKNNRLDRRHIMFYNSIIQNSLDKERNIGNMQAIEAYAQDYSRSLMAAIGRYPALPQASSIWTRWVRRQYCIRQRQKAKAIFKRTLSFLDGINLNELDKEEMVKLQSRIQKEWEDIPKEDLEFVIKISRKALRGGNDLNGKIDEEMIELIEDYYLILVDLERDLEDILSEEKQAEFKQFAQDMEEKHSRAGCAGG
jgi:hypothetical protein